jgi:hypothetical protein
MTARKPVTVNGNFNSYARLSSGTILVSGMVNFSTTPALFRSRDQGNTFEQVPAPPSIRALSQRNGVVYAAANNFDDGYAIGTSGDEGTTWTALMTYADVKAISSCLKAKCLDTCAAEVGLALWTADVCAADPPGTGSGGSGGSSGVAGQGGRAGGGGATGGAGAGPPPAKHGGCAIGGASDRAPAVLPLLLLVLAIVIGERRRSI